MAAQCRAFALQAGIPAQRQHFTAGGVEQHGARLPAAASRWSGANWQCRQQTGGFAIGGRLTCRRAGKPRQLGLQRTRHLLLKG